MKKITILLFAVLLGCNVTVFAEEYGPTASKDIYNLKPFGDKILDLFYNAFAQGRNCPTWTEFEAAGFTKLEINNVRSHVRKREIMVKQIKNINKAATNNRQAWLNMPMGIGKSVGGYPNENGSDDCFTIWNYTNLFGSWNHGLFSAPAVWVDAAHKNGTDIMTGIKFFESWTAGSGDQYWTEVVSTKNDLKTGPSASDTYKYSRAMIYALMFFGHDGINYNWEDGSYTNTDVVAFHKELYKIAAEVGFTNYHSGIYTASQMLTAANVESLFGKKATGKTHDLMLNYMNGDFVSELYMSNSVNAAVNNYGTYEGLYAGGWMAGLGRSWTNFAGASYANAKKIGICLWGEHAQSRIYSFTRGDDPVLYADNYQKQQEMLVSGGNRNPAKRPTPTNNVSWDNMTKFQGMAEYIPERTAIEGNLPFITHFNTGAGERYNYKGKKTLGGWYNMGAQDIVPTYRWLVYSKGTKTGLTKGIPEFTQEDAYTGGNCLRLNGTVAQDIVLYRTKLNVSAGNPKVSVALKRFSDAPPTGTISVIVKLFDQDDWLETPLTMVKGKTWEEQTVALNEVIVDDIIEYIGFRTTGDVEGLLVGRLAITDDAKATPAEIDEVLCEVKAETTKSLGVKMAWNVVDSRKGTDLLRPFFNDEANIDHFEIMYKNGEEGRISQVGTTTSWATYIPNIAAELTDKPFVGVRAVSVDGKTYGPIHWTELSRATDVPEPSATGNYPNSSINKETDGYLNAIKNRYFTYCVTEGGARNLNFQTTQQLCLDSTNYYFAEDQMLEVNQGDEVSLTFKVKGTYDSSKRSDDCDGLYWCCYKAYIDYDGNCRFDAEGDELLSSLIPGQAGGKINDDVTKCYIQGTTFNFTVPEDAVPGTSRIRFVFSDAWFPHPGPSGFTQKGYTIDFPVTITGTNPGREAGEDTHDQGLAPEPDGTATGVVDVNVDVDVDVAFDGENIVVTGADKVWVYATDARCLFFRDAAAKQTTCSLRAYPVGTYLVRTQVGTVFTTRKIVK